MFAAEDSLLFVLSDFLIPHTASSALSRASVCLVNEGYKASSRSPPLLNLANGVAGERCTASQRQQRPSGVNKDRGIPRSLMNANTGVLAGHQTQQG